MPKCFVIMPYGKKGPVGKKVDFNKVYKKLIKPSVVAVTGLSCERADEAMIAGQIQQKMLEDIYEADVAVVDISMLNANVFYELGVRHALTSYVTVIIKQKGTRIPFNINGMRTIEYDPACLADNERAPRKLQVKKDEITTTIRNGLSELRTDSLVYINMPKLEAPIPKKAIQNTDRYAAEFGGAKPKRIGVITGDIRNITGIDVWVSSENTNMQMARYYEKSISATIRYLGAKRENGRVIEDTVADALALELKGAKYVDAGEILATKAGSLEKKGVKRIFHAAAVQGQIGRGFVPIRSVDNCIRNALELADSEEEQNAALRSILFPLMGTGQGGGNLLETTRLLIETAKSYFEGKPDSVIEDVYFLCWTERDLKACEWAFAKAGLSLKPVTRNAPALANAAATQPYLG